MDWETIQLEAQELMDKAVQHALHEFTNIHTGKATPAMVENIIQPWDKGTSGAVEKAIREANLGLNPLSRGTTILVPIPELSGDRRKDLVKMAASHAEEGRVSVRQARHHAMDELKKLKAEGHVSEDDIKRYEKEIQDETDAHVKAINDALQDKEDELLTV
jgi:ribosome recycling factor